MDIGTIITPEIVNLVAQAAITLIGALITGLLAVGLRFLRTKLTAAQFAQVVEVVQIAVNAAEQLGLANKVEQKKDVALGIVVRELTARGIDIDEARLDALIEAAVMESFNYGRVPEPDADPEPEPEEVTVDADFAPIQVPYDTTGL